VSKTQKKAIAVGIDVSLDELHVALEGEDEVFVVSNDAAGHKKLAKRLIKGGRHAKVVVEATSTYHLDVAILLARTSRCEVMVANPRSTHAFHNARNVRAKTDRVDARSLMEFARTMPFVPWTAPEQSVLEFRAFAVYLEQLIKEQTRTRNQLHAASATDTASRWVVDQLRKRLDELGTAIELATAKMAEHASAHPVLAAAVERIVTIPAIGQLTAMRLTALFLVLDSSMTSKEITAWAGLDPRPKESGTSVRGRRAISKRGNARARASLYMSAVTATRMQGPFRALYVRISGTKEAPKKAKMVGIVAVMRKMLITAWALHRTQTTWCAEKAFPTKKMAEAA
jgi:transposase